jgi:hypothetical protein
VDHRGFHNLFECINILELGVWVSLGVFVVNSCNFGEILVLGAVPNRKYKLAWHQHYEMEAGITTSPCIPYHHFQTIALRQAPS